MTGNLNIEKLKPETVYLYDPDRKRHQPRKFTSPWNGPHKVTGKKNQLNFRISSLQGKEFLVHISRLKKANNLGIWEERQGNVCRRQRTRKKREPEEEEEMVIPADSIRAHVPPIS
jgi:hypothetical protein